MKSFRRVAAASNKTRVRGDHGYAGGKKHPKEIQEEKEVQRVMKQMLRSLSGMLKQEEKMLKQQKEENLTVTKRNVVPMIG